MRASLAAYLEDSGFSVLQASNGQQGLQVFERDKPDLVICDLRMPQMGGLELIRQVTELAPQTPVIVVSGAGVMNDAVEALRLGAADYLIKPLEDLAVLEHSVRRALDRARLLLENQRYREKLETANRELEASLNLLQEDQNAGRQVQMNMLPVSPWTIDEFQFAHQIIPSLYLSGDFVDYFRVDERRVAFYLADVSGHGASSAFVTVLLKFMTTRLLFESKRNGTLPEFTPSEVLGHINRGLISCKLGKHVTMVGGVIDAFDMRLAEGALDKTGDAVALTRADQRAELIVGIALAGKTQAADRRAQLSHQFVVDPGLGVDAARGGAVLAGVVIPVGAHAFDHGLQVGVVAHDHRSFAAQLQVRAFKCFGCCDPAAGFPAGSAARPGGAVRRRLFSR